MLKMLIGDYRCTPMDKKTVYYGFNIFDNGNERFFICHSWLSVCDTHLKNGARRVFFRMITVLITIATSIIDEFLQLHFFLIRVLSKLFMFFSFSHNDVMTCVTLTSGDGEYSATNWWTTVHSTPCSPIFLGRAMRIGTPTISPPVSVTVVGKCNRMVPSFPLTNILCGIPSLILRSVNPISSSGLKKMRCESDMWKF